MQTTGAGKMYVHAWKFMHDFFFLHNTYSEMWDTFYKSEKLITLPSTCLPEKWDNRSNKMFLEDAVANFFWIAIFFP